jgi:hypothetical protein
LLRRTEALVRPGLPVSKQPSDETPKA